MCDNVYVINIFISYVMTHHIHGYIPQCAYVCFYSMIYCNSYSVYIAGKAKKVMCCLYLLSDTMCDQELNVYCIYLMDF